MKRSECLDVAIINYEMSNLYSVQSACNYFGLFSEITNETDKILEARSAILPGVGSFGAAMENLKASGLSEVIRELIKRDKPFMGICLGMQLLFSESEEIGNNKGLNIIPGSVRRFPQRSRKNKLIKVPHIGWNKIKIVDDCVVSNWHIPPLNEIDTGGFMYFVHSLYCIPNDSKTVLTLTNYGDISFCSSLVYKNIFACQFHPERSGKEGLNIFKNFSDAVKNVN